MSNDNSNIKYKATMARARWRALYLKIELRSPSHKAAQHWLAEAASQIFDVAEVKIKAGGVLQADPFDGKKAEELVSMELTRDAVLGIKFAVTGALTGADSGKPSNLLERRDLLAACEGVKGPNGTLRKIVESEAKLQESDKLDENSSLEDMDKKPETE